MTFQEAIETGLPIRRSDKIFKYTHSSLVFGGTFLTTIMPDTFINPEFFLEEIPLTKEDILAKDWEVKFEFEMEECENYSNK